MSELEGLSMQQKKDVKISVVTATYNCVMTIDDCLRSIKEQTWANKEHVVIDGASTDGTVDRIRKGLLPGSFFISEKDQGIYDALNKGIKASTGEVVGFLHADDLYKHHNVLEKIASAFEDPEISAVYGDLQYVKKNGISQVVRNWKSSSYTWGKLKIGWMPPHPTLYIRKSWYEKIGYFDKSLRVSADYDSVLKLFGDRDFKSTYIPEVLVTMRLGGNSNRSLGNIIKKTAEDFKVIRRSGSGVVAASFAIAWKNLSKLTQLT